MQTVDRHGRAYSCACSWIQALIDDRRSPGIKLADDEVFHEKAFADHGGFGNGEIPGNTLAIHVDDFSYQTDEKFLSQIDVFVRK